MPRFVISKAAFAEAGEPSSTLEGGRRMSFAVPLNKLREQAALGLGERNAQQLAVERMMRTTEEDAELPRRVADISDVTKGLGLEPSDAERIERAIVDTNPTYTPRSGAQRIFQARSRLVDILRTMKHVDSDARIEIQKRAMAWWRLNYQTDLGRSMGPDNLRWPTAKSMRHVLRAEPVQLEHRPERLLKAQHGLPTSGGVGGPTNPAMQHPSLPDFYSLYFAPEAQARQEVEAKQSRRRRLSMWRDLDRQGFHGPVDEPKLRYKMGDTSLPDFATLKPMKHYLTEAELRRAQRRIVAGSGLDYEVVGGKKEKLRR